MLLLAAARGNVGRNLWYVDHPARLTQLMLQDALQPARYATRTEGGPSQRPQSRGDYQEATYSPMPHELDCLCGYAAAPEAIRTGEPSQVP